MSENKKSPVRWSSRWIFVLAATGSAVGLGNIWKFPYMVGKSGGSAFVLVYLVCILLIGLPVIMAEIMLGRRGRGSPVAAIRKLVKNDGGHPLWVALGWSSLLAGALILSYYSVIGGWTMAYSVKSAAGQFSAMPADQIAGQFGALVSDPVQLLIWHSAFMLMCIAVLARGVEQGLERAVRFLMPSLLLMILGLLVYSITSADFGAGVKFMFEPDFSQVRQPAVLVQAMGQAFFTITVGMGAMMVYGSYLPSDTPVSTTAGTVVFADTLIAILAGMIIFPIVFATGLQPGEGPGLIFQTLPTAFAQMPGGAIWGTVFFVLLVFAAWTSAISLLEPSIVWGTERFGWSRARAAWVLGGVIWAVGLLTVMSFNDWAFEFDFLGATKENGFFDIIDLATATVMLPLNGILIALFAGWVLTRRVSKESLTMQSSACHGIWLIAVRYLVPVGIGVVMLFSFLG